jgi:hypothetical protein
VAPVLAAAVALLPVAAVSGCTFVNPQITTKDYQPADGLDVELDDGMIVTQLLVVTRDQGDPGSVIARIINETSDRQQVTFTADGLDQTVTVPAGETLALGGVTDGSEVMIIDSMPEAPGLVIDMSVGLQGGTTQQLQVPVLDGTLEEYRPYLPPLET